MRAWWTRAGGVAIALAAAWVPRSARAADDVTGAPRPRRPATQQDGRPPGIDLAAHVDINVVLPPNHWRVNGGLRNVVIGGGGRLVIDGNLTIGGEPVPETAERIRRTDEAVLARLRAAQRDVLDKATAEPRITVKDRRSLELATEADIRRVMAEVAALRHRYDGVRGNLGDEQWQAFQKDVQLCRRAIADPFGADSLFAAVQAGFEP